MIYLLDTNVIIDLIKKDKKIEIKLKKYSQTDFAISNITLAELWYGVENSKDLNQKMTRLLALAAIKSTFKVIDFNNGIEKTYGEIVSKLKSINKYKKSDGLDYQIASTAVHKNLVLVTRNPSDFKYIQDLKYSVI